MGFQNDAYPRFFQPIRDGHLTDRVAKSIILKTRHIFEKIGYVYNQKFLVGFKIERYFKSGRAYLDVPEQTDGHLDGHLEAI